MRLITVQFSKHNGLLIECDSNATATQVRSYCVEENLLTKISTSAKLQLHTYHLVLKFVPCNSTFNPDNADQLQVLEMSHDHAEGSISSAAWIKKWGLHAPNQKVANVKITCSSPLTANHLLLERVFVANTRVVVVKDAQEPICCNKCQIYGHIWAKCNNQEWCATCADPHPSLACPNPNIRQCVSCGDCSSHASSDRDNCPLFAKQTTSLTSRVPENLLPYFPVLGLSHIHTPIPQVPTTMFPNQTHGFNDSTPTKNADKA